MKMQIYKSILNKVGALFSCFCMNAKCPSSSKIDASCVRSTIDRQISPSDVGRFGASNKCNK